MSQENNYVENVCPLSQLLFDEARQLAEAPVPIQLEADLAKVVYMLDQLAEQVLEQEQAVSPD